MKLETFFEKFEQFADAPDAVAKMRALVLALAVQGKLVPQDPRDEPAKEAIRRIPQQPRPARFDKRSNANIQGIAALSVGLTGRDIPSGWSCIPLIEIARLESGHTPSRSRPDWWGGDVPWVGVVDARLHNSKTIFETLQHTNEEGLANSAARLLPAGTVCVSRTASVGYVTILGKPMATSQDFVNWVPSEAVTSQWLQLVFTSEKDAFNRFSKGAVHQTIYYPEWLSMHTLLPPLAEQKRIVAKVDELMALCDRLEAQQQELETRHGALARASLARFADAPTPANLDFLFHKSYTIDPADLRKSILILAVQGKLVESDPAEEPVDDLLVKMQKHRQQLIDARKIRKPRDLPPVAKDELPFPVPASWRWTRWGQICDWITYGFTRPMAHVENGPPIVTAKNVQDGFMTFENAHRADTTEFADLNPKDLPRKGDILITKDGTIGRVAVVERDEPFCINQSVAVLWLESCLLYRPFMLMVIRSPFAQGPIWEAAEGMAIKHLSITDFGKMILPLPPLAEQRRIVAKVDQLMALVDQLETQLAASRSAAEKLMDALVAELTTKT